MRSCKDNEATSLEEFGTHIPVKKLIAQTLASSAETRRHCLPEWKKCIKPPKVNSLLNTPMARRMQLS